MPATTLLWYRADLRLCDHAALTAALARGGPVVPVFIWAPEEEAPWPPGAASRWWLHHSLSDLDRALRERGSRLVVRRGSTRKCLARLLDETGADAVFYSVRYEPAVVARDRALAEWLRRSGVQTREFGGSLLFEPAQILTQSREPYRVFTPFWKRCLAEPEPAPPRPAPRAVPGPRRWPSGEPLSALDLLPRIPWDEGLRESWAPGQGSARRRLARFAADVEAYPARRDRPDLPGTSRLSPHLHFGEISPQQVWYTLAEAERKRGALCAGILAFLRQLGWREFAYHLLWHFPQSAESPLRPDFARFPWRRDQAGLSAWQRGCTGFPMVDAGMRELWRTGWMHNRARMVGASFLTKHLLLPWQLGARWFWDTLVDADLANNSLGWQWTAGCGADAAPFFRIFNPTEQARKFDPEGAYARHWIPELAASRQGTAGTYPAPMVDHGAARARALAAFQSLRRPAR